MSSNNLVSVVVPSYNHEKYIVQALESVFKQTYSAIELIVLDDCSTDTTFETAVQWGRKAQVKNRFVRLCMAQNKRNSGAHATINTALAMANGNWLTILNSDDWYSPDRMEKVLGALNTYGGQYAFTSVSIVDKDGRSCRNDDFAVECMTLSDRLETYPSLGFALLEKNVAVTSGNIVFSRKLYQQVGPFADLKYAHDWDFLVRCLAFEEPLFVPESLYFYRIYPGNSFRKLVFEKFLEPQILYRRYLSTVECKNFTNINYPIYGIMNENLNNVKCNIECMYSKYYSIAKSIEQQVRNG